MDETLPHRGQSEDKPAHKVALTQPFYIGKFKVTQEQWLAIRGGNPSHFKDPKLPVEKGSWKDCQDFLAELQKKTGRRIALPTEAQREYACRAGRTTRFCFGDSDVNLRDYAWFSGNSNGRTHPVGEKKPNRWGLHDMHGNVPECCAGCCGSYPNHVITDPQCPPSGVYHGFRDGAWISEPNGVRAYNRAADFRDFGRAGLRLALPAGETARQVGPGLDFFHPIGLPAIRQEMV